MTNSQTYLKVILLNGVTILKITRTIGIIITTIFRQRKDVPILITITRPPKLVGTCKNNNIDVLV